MQNRRTSMPSGPRVASAIASALLVFTGLSGSVSAQEETDLPIVPDAGQNDALKELVELFHKVERNLERIDLELADAGAGELPLDAVEDSGLDDLLRATQERSQEVQTGIDRILEIARQMDQSSGGGGSSPPDQPQNQNQDPQSREQTPEAPKESNESDQPHESPNDPKSDKENPNDGENSADEAPPSPPPGDPSSAGPDGDEWGFLPDRLREVFRNQGGDDMPVQYRSWIDTYYRRLNRVER